MATLLWIIAVVLVISGIYVIPAREASMGVRGAYMLLT
ncbi:GPGG-motif small membrane protein [Streptosporangium sp. NPDC048865]